LKRIACIVLAVLMTGCLPIGIRGQNLPYQGSAASSH